jgi:hypothetical protein
MSKLNTLKKLLDSAGVEYWDIQESTTKKFIEIAYKTDEENISKLRQVICKYPYTLYNANIVSIHKTVI